MNVCSDCTLNNNKKYIPYIGPDTKFIIVADTPYKSSLLNENNSPFWNEVNKHQLRKSNFSIFYSINCFFKGNPSELHRNICRTNLVNLFNQTITNKLIISGNYALHTLTDRWGIKTYMNRIEKRLIFKKEYDMIYINSISSFFVTNDIKNSLERLKYV
jgi:hypothetical protein